MTKTTAADPRPLSPHLQIYRPQITSVLSISHRLTGLILASGMLMVVVWVGALAVGVEAFAMIQEFFASLIGRGLLALWCLALFYHLANGLRHLAWDIGLGFSLKAATYSGWLVVTFAVLATVITFMVGYCLR